MVEQKLLYLDGKNSSLMGGDVDSRYYAWAGLPDPVCSDETPPMSAAELESEG